MQTPKHPDRDARRCIGTVGHLSTTTPATAGVTGAQPAPRDLILTSASCIRESELVPSK